MRSRRTELADFLEMSETYFCDRSDYIDRIKGHLRQKYRLECLAEYFIPLSKSVIYYTVDFSMCSYKKWWKIWHSTLVLTDIVG